MEKSYSVVIRKLNDEFASRLGYDKLNKSLSEDIARDLNVFFYEQDLKFIARSEEDEEI